MSHMTCRAKTTPSRLSVPNTSKATNDTVVATRHASCLRPLTNSSEKTGMKAALNAVSDTMVHTRLGALKATVNAPISAPRPR
ncbi:MAG: hypothetical protein BWY79_01582 [Actinobacteria bacterium ADurb.Bin444]|nr:MAG: hypothetical protein BWY79_01582 [Actinobacteria bacterium ADurb.Bin444]